MVILREGLCPGLTAEMVCALKTNNIQTVVDLVSSDLEEVVRKSFVSYKMLVAVRRILLAEYSAFPSNGANLYEELKSSTAILSTGNRNLDTLLDSGLYTGEVTEFAGAAGSGKTQVCLSIAVNVSHSLKQHVLYIDSTGGLMASRLFQLVQVKTQEEEEQVEVMQRIEVVQAFDIYKMLDALQDLRCSVSQQVVSPASAVRVLIVDSVCAVIYPLLGGKHMEGMSLMMQLGRELKIMARELNLAVVLTNHMTRNINSGLRPALGRSWSFMPSTRILLEKKEGIQRNSTIGHTATLSKSSRQPTGLSVGLAIGSSGALQESPSFVKESLSQAGAEV
uniref:DNA repair protein RAD51 homolog 4 n=1 Tax=Geotrypetes seraphini TaxID=260995 RepID=A0A6P8NQF9_GEOSA|nr:DNA repair protein RAD51 homolog 4 [Geotrypetes seraphini]XP_033778492.1 DNA repair protein RAD51 homolog 4 [Geotrypetes seraphini]